MQAPMLVVDSRSSAGALSAIGCAHFMTAVKIARNGLFDDDSRMDFLRD
jgi:hypothetical protein